MRGVAGTTARTGSPSSCSTSSGDRMLRSVTVPSTTAPIDSRSTRRTGTRNEGHHRLLEPRLRREEGTSGESTMRRRWLTSLVACSVARRALLALALSSWCTASQAAGPQRSGAGSRSARPGAAAPAGPRGGRWRNHVEGGVHVRPAPSGRTVSWVGEEGLGRLALRDVGRPPRT